MSDGPGGWLEQWGVHIIPAFSGLAGGVVAAFMNKAATMFEWLFYCATALLTANFLGPSAAHLVPIWNGQPILDQEGVGYIVGTTATVIFWGMTSIVKKYVDVASLTRGADK